jgi:hypothetical protein
MANRVVEQIMRTAAWTSQRDPLRSPIAETPAFALCELIEPGALDLWIVDDPGLKSGYLEAMRHIIIEAPVRK